ncbi:hypothetical protein [Parafrankia sp. EUN1f]|uniref:hypothetical protein n=1 Tax=Parafrankia sp. EUN1f TaxID=102897 RepID=UPI0001C450E7|nr:hypothetical protein [Parafrankia sp. EUN1f]EFC86640.1 conserved hypothetical protein [Parafrankia sp. EUN1f]
MRSPDRTSTDAAISDHAGGRTASPVPGVEDALGFLSAAARALSDTVLYEGYLLYPYRSDALKNQQHWQFGVLMPPSFAGAGSGEHSNAHTEFLLDGGPDARLTVALRWLWEHDGARGEAATALRVRIADVLDEPARRELTYTPPQPTPSTPAARGELLLDAQRLPGPYGGFRIRATVRNISAGEPPHAAAGSRDAALGAAFIGLQLVAHVAPGEFLSPADPPEWAAHAAADCANERLWPALLGRPGRSGTLLAAPIILPDDPHLAAESPTSFCDATEIDEVLALRTATLTETERRDARAGDPRAAELLDAVAELAPAMVEKLHGRTRIGGSDPGRATPATPATQLTPSPQLVEGAKVWVRPHRGRTDAQDMFVDGAAATVAAVLHDLDGRTHIAVTLDEDPGADLRREFGRFLYFRPDELEPR